MKGFQAIAGVGLLLVLTLLGAPITAWAQYQANDERTYGTASPVVHTLQALAFTQRSGGSTSFNNFRSISCTGGADCPFEIPVFLPAGALVTRIEIDGCLIPTSRLHLTLLTVGIRESSNLLSDSQDVSTGFTQCVNAGVNLTSPITIDNANNTYVVLVNLHSTSGAIPLDGNTRFQAVRIRYQLQVSPAPATARFNDVPTNHLFFQFIEALAAAGITGGCSTTPPLYCPDDPVTRGQMAVFISRALGLHFAP